MWLLSTCDRGRTWFAFWPSDQQFHVVQFTFPLPTERWPPDVHANE